MKQKLTFMEILPIGLMLFASFFGAGNLIFPPALGQSAGVNFLPAAAGFCTTGVGIPLLGIIAIGLCALPTRKHWLCRYIPNLPRRLLL